MPVLEILHQDSVKTQKEIEQAEDQHDEGDHVEQVREQAKSPRSVRHGRVLLRAIRLFHPRFQNRPAASELLFLSSIVPRVAQINEVKVNAIDRGSAQV